VHLVAEFQLSKRGFGVLEKEEIDVVGGEFGLGQTAVAAIADELVASLVVAAYLEAVIAWHQIGRVPLGKRLSGDSRCRPVRAALFKGGKLIFRTV
jgi:hypothetical protein